MSSPFPEIGRVESLLTLSLCQIRNEERVQWTTEGHVSMIASVRDRLNNTASRDPHLLGFTAVRCNAMQMLVIHAPKMLAQPFPGGCDLQVWLGYEPLARGTVASRKTYSQPTC